MSSARVGGLLTGGALIALVLVWLALRPHTADDQRPLVAPTPPAAVEPAAELPRVEPAGDVSAISPGEQRPAEPHAESGPAPAAAESVAEPSPVHVVVIDMSGAPVAGARVRTWVGEHACDADWPADEERITDGVGRATLALKQEQGVLLADREDLGSSAMWSRNQLGMSVDQEGETPIQLEPLAHVVGHVLEADGRPAAAVHVRAGRYGGDVRFNPRVPADTLTDNAGRFELAVGAGAFLALQAVDGPRRTADERLELGVGTMHEVTLRFPGDWGITGTVEDARGRPGAGAAVRAWLDVEEPATGDGPRQNCFTTETKAGADGRFRLDVLSLGRYTLIARPASGPASEAATVQLDADATRPSVALVLPDAAAISGRLHAATGAPYAGVTINALPETGSSYLPQADCYAPIALDRFGQARAVTDADGRFRLEPLHPAGSYRLGCRPDPAASQLIALRTVVPAGTELDWSIDAEELVGSVVTGVVLSGETGEPLAEYGVQLVERQDNRLSFPPCKPTRDDAGHFRIEGLRLGTEYALVVTAQGWARSETPWWVAGPQPHEVIVRLPRPGALEVEVRDASGALARLASVSVTRQAEIFDFNVRLPQQTGANGRLELADLDPGTWHVVAFLGEQRAETEVTISAGATSRVWLDLRNP